MIIENKKLRVGNINLHIRNSTMFIEINCDLLEKREKIYNGPYFLKCINAKIVLLKFLFFE